MTPREANVLLTKIALLDGRYRREPEEQAQMATAWAVVLGDVSLTDADTAVNEHYATETRGILPADIIAAVPPLRSASWAGNITEQRLAGRLGEIES